MAEATFARITTEALDQAYGGWFSFGRKKQKTRQQRRWFLFGQREKPILQQTPFLNATHGVVATFQRYIADVLNVSLCEFLGVENTTSCEETARDEDFVAAIRTVPLIRDNNDINITTKNYSSFAPDLFSMLDAAIQETATLVSIHPRMSSGEMLLMKMQCTLARRQVQALEKTAFDGYDESILQTYSFRDAITAWSNRNDRIKRHLSAVNKVMSQGENMQDEQYYHYKIIKIPNPNAWKSGKLIIENLYRDHLKTNSFKRRIIFSKALDRVSVSGTVASYTEPISACPMMNINTQTFHFFCERAWLLTRKEDPKESDVKDFSELWQPRSGFLLDVSGNRIGSFINGAYAIYKHATIVDLSHNSLLPMPVLKNMKTVVYPAACHLIASRDVSPLLHAIAEGKCLRLCLDGLLLDDRCMHSAPWSRMRLQHLSLAHNRFDIAMAMQRISTLTTLKSLDVSDNRCDAAGDFLSAVFGMTTLRHINASKCGISLQDLDTVQQSMARSSNLHEIILYGENTGSGILDSVIRQIIMAKDARAYGESTAEGDEQLRGLLFGSTRSSTRDIHKLLVVSHPNVSINKTELEAALVSLIGENTSISIQQNAYERIRSMHNLPHYYIIPEATEASPTKEVAAQLIRIPIRWSAETGGLRNGDIVLSIINLPARAVPHHAYGRGILPRSDRDACLTGTLATLQTEWMTTVEEQNVLTEVTMGSDTGASPNAVRRLISTKSTQLRASSEDRLMKTLIRRQGGLLRDKIMPLFDRLHHLIGMSTWLFLHLIDKSWGLSGNTQADTLIASSIVSLFPASLEVALVDDQAHQRNQVTLADYAFFNPSVNREHTDMKRLMMKSTASRTQPDAIRAIMTACDRHYAKFLHNVGDYPRRMELMCASDTVGISGEQVQYDTGDIMKDSARMDWIISGLLHASDAQKGIVYSERESDYNQMIKGFVYRGKEINPFVYLCTSGSSDAVSTAASPRSTLVWYLYHMVNVIYDIDAAVATTMNRDLYPSRSSLPNLKGPDMITAVGGGWGAAVRLMRRCFSDQFRRLSSARADPVVTAMVTIDAIKKKQTTPATDSAALYEWTPNRNDKERILDEFSTRISANMAKKMSTAVRTSVGFALDPVTTRSRDEEEEEDYGDDEFMEGDGEEEEEEEGEEYDEP